MPNLERVDPQLLAATRRITRFPLPPPVLLRALTRIMPAPRMPGVQVHHLRHGWTTLRVYRPDTLRSDAALLWIHGGGLLFGDAKQDELLCGATAIRLGMTVVSANYRFPPAHPFPAALDDVFVAWRWTQGRAGALGVDPERVAIGGESAGGGLAAALVQRVHDQPGNGAAAQWLFAPMLDDRTAACRELDAADHPVWNNRMNRAGWSGYLGTVPGAEQVPPYAVPARRVDLRGLPPAYLTWGDIELFAEEDLRYAQALRAAGVEVTTDVVPGAPHGFENWARRSPPAQALTRRAQDWLAGQLGISPAD